MNPAEYAKGVTAGDLRVLLEFWPQLMAEGQEIQQESKADESTLFPQNSEFFGWCYLYELPIKDHLNVAMTGNIQILSDFISIEQVGDWFGQLKDAPSQIGEIPAVCSRISDYFDAQPNPDETQSAKLQIHLATLYGNALSITNTMRSILYHGCFLNELIERVREGDDAALFAAVRCDRTVIGCPSVVQRISKAAILEDEDFFNDLRNSIEGKQTKRAQENFQMMRLAIEILHEAGAIRLTDNQLWQLFVEELDLYSSNSNPKALRKWVDTYMKENATTKKHDF
jgi:hypothetical protein